MSILSRAFLRPSARVTLGLLRQLTPHSLRPEDYNSFHYEHLTQINEEILRKDLKFLDKYYFEFYIGTHTINFLISETL